MRTATRLGLSVLAAGQDNACRSLPVDHGDRFDNVDWNDTERLVVLTATHPLIRAFVVTAAR